MFVVSVVIGSTLEVQVQVRVHQIVEQFQPVHLLLKKEVKIQLEKKK
jgi:hypothetical protein